MGADRGWLACEAELRGGTVANRLGWVCLGPVPEEVGGSGVAAWGMGVGVLLAGLLTGSASACVEGWAGGGEGKGGRGMWG